MVVRGRATAAIADGNVVELKKGDVFHIAPGHRFVGHRQRAVRLRAPARRGRLREI